MNFKKISIISILVVTNIVAISAALIFYSAMRLGINELVEEENHHLSLKVRKLKGYILSENEGLTIKQFKEKHQIGDKEEDYVNDPNIVGYSLLFFKFKNGVINDIE